MQHLSLCYEISPLTTNNLEIQTENTGSTQTPREDTDNRITSLLRDTQIIQNTGVEEKLTTGVEGYCSSLELSEKQSKRTTRDELVLTNSLYTDALRQLAKKREKLLKLKQRVCGYADNQGLLKFSDEELLNRIKEHVPKDTYEHVYVTKDKSHLFDIGVRPSRKIQLIRSETFLEGMTAFFEAVPAFFNSLFYQHSDFRLVVKEDKIADELLEAKKQEEINLGGSQIELLSAERQRHIKAAFRQWLSITIWVEERCKCKAEVQITHASSTIKWSIESGILLNHLIGRE